MPRKTTILIVVLILVTGALLFLAVKEKQKVEQQTKVTSVPSPTPVKKTATIYFEPSVVTSNGQTLSSDVFVKSGENEITGVQLELSFDPSTLSNVMISEPEGSSFFGAKGSYVVLFKNVDYQKGRISYAIAITPTEQPKVGNGKIATISFTKKPGADKAQTQILFLNKTMVTELGVGESVLRNNPKPLLINIGSSPSGEVCAQVITSAKNPKTGECKDFSTPCDVPAGWTKVGSCNNL